MKSDRIPANREIKSHRVVLIGSNGSKLGEFLRDDAIAMAEAEGLDLVLVNDAEKPICKIMDLGKYLYEQKKKQKKNASNSFDVKEIKLNFTAEQNYVDLKTKQARNFLEKGDKVKVTVQFKGREGTHLELVKRKIFLIFKDLEDIAEMESPPKFGDRQICMTLAFKK